MYEELFGKSVGLARRQAANHPLEFSTPLYREWEVAKSIGRTIEEYRQLSQWERHVQYYSHILANEKERHQYDKIQEEREAEAAARERKAPLHKGGARY